MSIETLNETNPPVIAFGTFMNFVDRMRHGLPSLVDRSVFPSLAGGVQGQLLAALRYFDLINQQGKPTELFADVAKAETGERQLLFRRMIEQHYPFCFTKSFDLARTTRNQLEKVFAERCAARSNLQKAVLFFLAFAGEAGLKISNHILSPADRAQPARRHRIRKNDPEVRKSQWSEQSRGEEVALLTAKLPTFDLNWSEEFKVRWLDSFDRLAEVLKAGSVDVQRDRVRADHGASQVEMS